MCTTCGCTDTVHDHHHEHDPGHSHAADQRYVSVEQDVLSQNNLLAAQNRGFFQRRKILAINLVSSPGSGKTSLLERTLIDLKGRLKFYVIEGDQQTAHDAERIRATGTPVIQINTGKGCHLDAHMIRHAVEKLAPSPHSVLFIENVGNLVCPAGFDLGEDERVVMMSVTEGEDKPLKYPYMFHSSTLCLITKTDLLPYVPFQMDRAGEYARANHAGLEFIELSVRPANGLETWYEWLLAKAERKYGAVAGEGKADSFRH